MAQEDFLHGKEGAVKLDPAGGAATVVLAYMTGWDLDMSKDRSRVTPFQATNHVYVEGLPDLKGTFKGNLDPVDGLGIFDVIFGTVKPTLELFPDLTNYPLIKFGGKALVDGKLSVDAGGPIALSGSFVGAGPWTYPGA